MTEHFLAMGNPGRKTPAQGVKLSLAGPNIILLTVNSKGRVPWLAQPSVHASLRAIWRNADGWLVGHYVLMPDHLHMFCAPRDLRFTIERWLAFWKSQFSRQNIDQPWAWQRSGFHHRLRHARQYEEKWHYVRNNPIRKGLVAHPEDWPFQGTIHQLTW